MQTLELGNQILFFSNFYQIEEFVRVFPAVLVILVAAKGVVFYLFAPLACHRSVIEGRKMVDDE